MAVVMEPVDSPLDVRGLSLLVCLPSGIFALGSSYYSLFPGFVCSSLTRGFCVSSLTSGDSHWGLAGSRLSSSVSISPPSTCSHLLRLAGPGSP